MASKLTVHMIGNGHLDPVWMWTWPFGMDEAINTSRTMCTLLDEYPELVVTRGEAWVYEQLRRLTPDLFERIKAFVTAGRWSVVNGWWIQPDTDHPTAESFVKQGRIGKAWFAKHLGVDVRTGYQVDSFGQAAMIPAFLKAVGMPYYLFGRPFRRQCELPAELFIWQAPTGERVIAQRTPRSYCARSIEDVEAGLADAIEHANREVGHAVSFFGIGDHGGGPSREQIEWIIEHRRYADDVELVFSNLDAYFDAVAESGVELPVHSGELASSLHGCHSVQHDFRQQHRLAETLVSQAEALVAAKPKIAPSDAAEQLERAWTLILFNQFHDILAGTSVEAAYEHARDELGSAKMTARSIIADMTRRETVTLGSCLRQRLLLHNITDTPFSGWVETEPWLGHDAPTLPVRFTDATGQAMPIQKLAGQAAERKMWRYLVHASVLPHKRVVIEVDNETSSVADTGPVSVDTEALSNGSVRVAMGRTGIASITHKDVELIGPLGIRVISVDDPTDTWGGGLPNRRFDGTVLATAESAEPWRVIDGGPLRGRLSNEMRLGRSSLIWQVWLDGDEPIVRVRLRLNVQAEHEIIKLVVPPAFDVLRYIAGTPGTRIERPMLGDDRAVMNEMSLHGADASLSVVSADTYAGDVQPCGTMRVTLTRCPNYVHNGNFPQDPPDKHAYPLTDQGEHVYELAIMPGAADAAVDAEIHRQTRPIWISETTDGMPPRHHLGKRKAN